MAFDIGRFATLKSGQTGGNFLALYDASGSAAEGGDTLAVAKGANFPDHDAVRDAVRQASRETAGGNGASLPVLIHGNDGMEMTVWYITGGRTLAGGADFTMT